MSPLDRLTQELSKLPGIGRKTALRLALHILRQDSNYAKSLAGALVDVAEQVSFCCKCFHFTHVNPCSICSDLRRNQEMICVVQESSDLLAIERTNGYRGMYHVLGGALSPLDGIGPEQLRINELAGRIKKGIFREIILATNPTVTGEATALYLSRLIKPLNVRVTKLASGIPVGGEIEYADSLTLVRALESRKDF